MAALVAAIEGVVDESDAPDAVAELLVPRLRDDGILCGASLPARNDGYTQHILHVDPPGRFSVAALVWLPGQQTPVHDHVSWCVVGVCRGCERETLYAAGADGLLRETGRRRNQAGSVSALRPPGDIHRVACHGHQTTVSLHVYGADLAALGSSIRRCYS